MLASSASGPFRSKILSILFILSDPFRSHPRKQKGFKNPNKTAYFSPKTDLVHTVKIRVFEEKLWP